MSKNRPWRTYGGIHSPRPSLSEKLAGLSLDGIADIQIQAEVSHSKILQNLKNLKDTSEVELAVFDLASIESEIETLRSEIELVKVDAKFNKSGWLSYFFPGLTNEGRCLVDEIYARIGKLFKILRRREELETEAKKQSKIIKECKKRIKSATLNVNILESSNEILERIRLERNEKLRIVSEEKQREREKINSLKAAAASAIGKGREYARTVRSKLELPNECPYCGCELGLDRHADHIYPLSKGGFSTIKNMVIVCSDCNKKKGAMTLNSFIVLYALDREAVESRLNALGKEF